MMIYVTGNTTFYQCNSIGNTAGNFTVVIFGGFTAGSDLSGSSTNQTVIGIRGVPVNNAATSTNAGYALVTNSSGQYVQSGVAPVIFTPFMFDQRAVERPMYPVLSVVG